MTMSGEEKLEALRLRDEATTDAYARGIKDMLVLTFVALLLVAVGMYVLMTRFW